MCRIIALIVSLLVLSGVACVAEPPPTPNIEATESAIVEALPSQTPYPTPTAPPGQTPYPTPQSLSTQEPQPTGEGSVAPASPNVTPASSSGCLGADGIRKIRAEYAANSARTQETYVGQRICLTGTISSFYESEGRSIINMTVGEDARFSLSHIDKVLYPGPMSTAEEERLRWFAWRAWMLESNVGDVVEAECRIEAFTPTKVDPKKTPGIPLFRDCQRVVGGVLWTPPIPTPTPAPTPAPIPCIEAEFGERSSEWLVIDCPAGKVTAGKWVFTTRSGELQFLSDGDSSVVSFQFLSIDETQSDVEVEHPSQWTRRVEDAPDGESKTEVWEAPPEAAAALISRWQRGGSEWLILVFGECCSVDMYIELNRPE